MSGAGGHQDLREAMVATSRRMNTSGLNQGTSGNLSQRVEGGFLLTPSGMNYETMTPEDLVLMRFDGSHEGHRKPSTEWQLHRDILQARPEVGAVLHAHSMFSTTLACLRRGIPAFHYMVSAAGGTDIRCAEYATFGTPELARHMMVALEGRKACLLANHGMVALGVDLAAAWKLAVEVETLAAMYWRALQVGEPVVLDDAEMERVFQQFRGYGQ
ncbi:MULTISPECIES: class II aldolase/adducin family protein [unclassified Corallococcus]|uniref:class II aldolase/adducin family protein n=1 Tax=unclassified Corallococcus TaxID=2685029 RepID=UPI001A90B9D6|nr:class II aldolase/adducin family protein [Corallococcus sp. NCRR]MBN9682474.1 class II aldolase/adducin family protein [Corallococcus sp. NCSPR001]WAS85973.1 class II aldolase/adducin family protein [Corallococcus sp. NCRR]